MNRMKDGPVFRIPVSRKPSDRPPCRAIAEAAGIPGVCDGHGRLTRKRFIRLVMSTGNSRNDAEYLAYAAHRNGVSYRECLQRTIVPMIQKADASMEDLFSGKILSRLELIRDGTEEEGENGADDLSVSDESARDAEI